VSLSKAEWLACLKTHGLRANLVRPTRYAWLRGQGVKIGIIDTGVPRNPILNKLVRDARSFVLGDANPISHLAHGEDVMGRIAVFADRSEYFVAKVTNTLTGISETAVLKALGWLVDDIGVDIINMSLGFRQGGTLPDGRQGGVCTGSCIFCQDVVAYSRGGPIIVAAAGNDGPDYGTIDCPASAVGILAVGAVDDARQLLDSSGRGLQTHEKPDLVAHGVAVRGQGTSYAAPVVTGLLASGMSQFPSDIAKSKLQLSCEDLKLDRHEAGFGLVNPRKYVEVLTNVQLPHESDERGSPSEDPGDCQGRLSLQED
jgi:serine protease AprX